MSRNAVVGMIVAAGAVLPFAVVAKRTMWRGGRHWSAGVHVFDTGEKLDALGAPEQVETMLTAVVGDSANFEVHPATKPSPDQAERQQQERDDAEEARLAAEAEQRRQAEAEEKRRADEAKWTKKYESSARLKEEFPTVEAYIAAQRDKQD